MRLDMPAALSEGYRSGAQIARRVTEAWALANVFCASCARGDLSQSPPNTKATDFVCPDCDARYQLKSAKTWNERSIPDAGYAAMIEAIRADQTPNLLVMHYAADWSVRQLMLVPSFFFSEAAVQRRRPLAPTARRAGWVGCNILLSAIAPEGKIRIVEDGTAVAAAAVRAQYARVRPLAAIRAETRGWTLDVLRVIRTLGRPRFDLRDVYGHDAALQVLHPGNRNVRPKIRQQLQVLRDLGFVRFLGGGSYELID